MSIPLVSGASGVRRRFPVVAALALSALVALGCSSRETRTASAAGEVDSASMAAAAHTETVLSPLPRDTTDGGTSARRSGEALPSTAARDTAFGGPDIVRSVRGEFRVDDLVAADELDARSRMPTPGDLRMLSGEMMMPLDGIDPESLTDSFNDARGSTRQHHALDVIAPRGTPVRSATPGTLLKLHTSQAGGLMVYAADSADRFVLMYAHLDRYAAGLSEGMALARGQVIGYVGTTGNAPPNTPHLHFAIASPSDVGEWWTGVPVDPRPLLQHHP